VFSSIGTISFFIQNLIWSPKDSVFAKTLLDTYAFHGVFSIVLVVIFQILSEKKQFFSQLGFIYIGSLVFKLVVSGIMMKNLILDDQILPRVSRAALLVPILLFIILEVVWLIKILKKQSI